MLVRLVQHVEIFPQRLAMRRRRLALEKIHAPRTGPPHVGIVRLIRPAVGEKRLPRLFINPLDQPVDEVAILRAPRREFRRFEIVVVLHGVVARAREQHFFAAPIHVAIVQVGRAPAARLEHRGQRRRQAVRPAVRRAPARRVAPRQAGVDGKIHRHESAERVGRMRMHIVENQRVLCLLEQVRRGRVAAAVQAQIFRPHRLQDHHDDIARTSHIRRRLKARARGRAAVAKRLQLVLILRQKLPRQFPMTAAGDTHQRRAQQLHMRTQHQPLRLAPEPGGGILQRTHHDPRAHAADESGRKNPPPRTAPRHREKPRRYRHQREADGPRQPVGDGRLHRRAPHQPQQVETERTIQRLEHAVSHHAEQRAACRHRHHAHPHRACEPRLPPARRRANLADTAERQRKKHIAKRHPRQLQRPAPRLRHAQRHRLCPDEHQCQPETHPHQSHGSPHGSQGSVRSLRIVTEKSHVCDAPFAPGSRRCPCPLRRIAAARALLARRDKGDDR